MHSIPLKMGPLNLFQHADKKAEVISGRDVEYQPLAGLTNTGPYRFHVHTEGNDFIILPQTKLYGKFKVLKKVGGEALPLAAADDVSIINLACSSLFRKVEIDVNGCYISDNSSNAYGYKHYIEMLLSYGSASKKTHLLNSLWYKDTATHFDAVTNDLANAGYKTRRGWLQKEIEFETSISSDFLTIQKYWPSNCSIGFTFERNSDDFVLLTEQATNFFIEITELKLVVRRVQLREPIYTALEDHFRSGEKAIFEYNRTVLKNYLLVSETLSKVEPNIVRGPKPISIVVCFVEADAFNGTKLKNPYNLAHFDIERISLRVDGITIPSYPLTMDVALGHTTRMYNNLFLNTGIHNYDDSNAITHNEFYGGFFLVPFDLTPTLNNGLNNVDKDLCSIDLFVKFKTALTNHVEMIVYEVHQDVLSLDKHRQIKFGD